jgi:hypothetical protein
VTHQRPGECLDLLVGHQADLGPGRVLEPGGEEVDPLHPAAQEADLQVPQVVLRELARPAFETHEGAAGPTR